eukprot:852052-Pyramimonas_sp.AAC.1
MAVLAPAGGRTRAHVRDHHRPVRRHPAGGGDSAGEDSGCGVSAPRGPMIASVPVETESETETETGRCGHLSDGRSPGRLLTDWVGAYHGRRATERVVTTRRTCKPKASTQR